ncbi:hypothetical protein F0562_013940 [Nyssa sinensis]|uniref:Uncharacterized protein n=1 Tax=Nyssa sinensis TaxID=561372 RepID=A0A5J4ZLY0_9ASTE|nr:hypothetical protein F0562_013940 [Nyssa sinensis]
MGKMCTSDYEVSNSQLPTVATIIMVNRLNFSVSRVHAFVGVGIADESQNVKWMLLLKFLATSVSAAPIYPPPIFRNLRSGGASSRMLMTGKPLRQEAEIHVLARGGVPPSSPSHKGHKKPITSRHLPRSDRSFRARRCRRSLSCPGDGH